MVTFSTDGRSGDVHPVNPEVVENFVKQVWPEHCISYKDPLDTVMQSMNELMYVYRWIVTVLASRTFTDAHSRFYEGALSPTLPIGNDQQPPTSDYYEQHLDPGLRVNTTVTGYLDGPHEVYSTNLWYFFAAAVIECVSIAFILPTYLGFWKLGRHVTFSPLEIAKVSLMTAFWAPMALTD